MGHLLACGGHRLRVRTKFYMVEEKQDDVSMVVVQQRREWVAEQYLSGVLPQAILRQYKSKYNLTKHSFDKDITYVRQNMAISVRESFDEILNDQMAFLLGVIDKATQQGDIDMALKAQKQATDL